MNEVNNIVACSICGDEHENDTSPELDSTHLCAECAANMRALRAPERVIQRVTLSDAK